MIWRMSSSSQKNKGEKKKDPPPPPAGGDTFFFLYLKTQTKPGSTLKYQGRLNTSNIATGSNTPKKPNIKCVANAPAILSANSANPRSKSAFCCQPRATSKPNTKVGSTFNVSASSINSRYGTSLITLNNSNQPR